MAGLGRDSRNRLIDAAIQVICAARTPREVTVREIAKVAQCSVSALYQSYGSLDDLVVATAQRLYSQINLERMSALQAAADRAMPEPAPLRDILTALIGPPVRWSLDPSRPYAVFRHVNALSKSGGSVSSLRPLIDQVTQHRAFVAHLQRAAPWFDEVEIGWRVNAALGVRSQVLREQRRTMLLTQNRLDLSDAETVIELLLDVIEPMFRPRPVAQPRLRADARPSSAVADTSADLRGRKTGGVLRQPKTGTSTRPDPLRDPFCPGSD